MRERVTTFALFITLVVSGCVSEFEETADLEFSSSLETWVGADRNRTADGWFHLHGSAEQETTRVLEILRKPSIAWSQNESEQLDLWIANVVRIVGDDFGAESEALYGEEYEASSLGERAAMRWRYIRSTPAEESLNGIVNAIVRRMGICEIVDCGETKELAEASLGFVEADLLFNGQYLFLREVLQRQARAAKQGKFTSLTNLVVSRVDQELAITLPRF